MKSLVKFAVAALLTSESVNAATDEYTYSYVANGADWPQIVAKGTECNSKCQSPIDLRTEGNTHPYQQGNGREFVGKYKNFKNAKVVNKGMTIQVDIPKDDQENNFFESGYSQDDLGGDLKFTSAQFHFHAKSEHTIDGKRYDLEMHTVHVPGEAKGNDVTIKYSALGLMFDVDDYDPSVTPDEKKVINDFFDSMNFGNVPPTGKASGHELNGTAEVPFGDLMRIANFANRWVYTGSLTTPPCTVGVYFQVVDRVLPISKKHYDLYLMQQREYLQTSVMEKDGDAHKETPVDPPIPLDVTGNWRVTQKIDDHNVTYMRVNFPVSQKGRYQAVTVVVVILLVISIGLAAVLAFCAFRMKKQIKDKEGMMAEGGHALETENGIKNQQVRPI